MAERLYNLVIRGGSVAAARLLTEIVAGKELEQSVSQIETDIASMKADIASLKAEGKLQLVR